MRKKEGVRTGNSDEKRDINQNTARAMERIVSLSPGLNLQMRRLSLINNSKVVLQWDINGKVAKRNEMASCSGVRLDGRKRRTGQILSI